MPDPATPHPPLSPLRGRRIVVKVGSALLVDDTRGTLRRQWMDAFAADLAALRAAGQEVVLVSSGAIACGRRSLNLPRRSLRLEEKQAAAATGQIRLAHAWQEALAPHHITVAQVLLTPEDTEARRRYLNARSTLTTLLRLGAIPVINENDTVATEEIRFGDNDRLAARVAAMMSADVLVLLSDIDGLYTADPRKDPEARLVPEVREITAQIRASAGEPNPAFGTGGMVTKLLAADICMAAGCKMIIAFGHKLHPLRALLDGGPSTTFVPAESPWAARKHWIAGVLKPAGSVSIDAGATRALQAGKSLLPAGVRRVDGDFQKGDVVRIFDGEGREVGRGLVAYPSEEARRIASRRSEDIEGLLGYRGREELIHRDDLVLERWMGERAEATVAEVVASPGAGSREGGR